MAKLRKLEREAVIDALIAEYPDAGCALKYATKFQLLVAVVLSAQTTDVSVNKVTPALFAAAPDAAAMAALPVSEIESMIRSIGMYRQKASRLSALSKILQREYGGEVPGDYEKLTTLPGVGPQDSQCRACRVFR